jgi:hypothetical protein
MGVPNQAHDSRRTLARLTGRLRIYRAIPEASVRAPSQAAWICAVDDHPEYATLRVDAAHNLRRVAWALARYADWRSMVARPGWELLIELTGLSRSTIQRALRRLRDWGLLGVVESGTTWWTRGGRDDDTDGNRAAQYVLCIPKPQAVDESDPRSLLREEERTQPPRARAHTPAATPGTPAPWRMCDPAVTGGDMLRAAERARARAPMLARLSARYLRHLWRVLFVAGWTLADVLHALDHTPDGRLRWHTAPVLHVAGWIRHRLKAWRGQTPPSQRAAPRTTDLTAADVARHAPVVAATRQTGLAERRGAAARALLAAASPRSRAVIERRGVRPPPKATAA